MANKLKIKVKEDARMSMTRYGFCPHCGAKAPEPEENWDGEHIYVEYVCENCWSSWYLDYVFKKMYVTSEPNDKPAERKMREQKGLKVTVVGGKLAGTYDVEDLWKYANGKTPPSADGSARAILGNQPLLPDYVGPMWDGDGLRYESPQVYRLMSL